MFFFVLFAATVRVRVYYVDIFVFFVLRHGLVASKDFLSTYNLVRVLILSDSGSASL